MPRKKPKAPPPADLVPLTLSSSGFPAITIYVRGADVRTFARVMADRHKTAQAEALARRSSTRRPSEDRFQRGLLLLAWIGAPQIGKGKLTLELVNDVKKHCPDWPEVVAYHQSSEPEPRRRERRRQALKALVDDTRRAIQEGRLPPGWRLA
jgi:hypothetical protein